MNNNISIIVIIVEYVIYSFLCSPDINEPKNIIIMNEINDNNGMNMCF